MNENVWNLINKIMDKVKPFIALAVLILIIVSSYGLYKNNKLQEEVKLSCGYQQTEDVFCVCDKNVVSNFDVPNNPYYNELNLTKINISKNG